MAIPACNLPDCQQLALRGWDGYSCRLCDGFLCRRHLGSSEHRCPKTWDLDAYHGQFYKKQREYLGSLVALLEQKGPQICLRASSLRAGVPCTIDGTQSTLSRMAGGRHFHAEIRFEDDVAWLLRLPIDHKPESRGTRNYFLECEAATMRFLARKTSLPTPNVHDWSLEGDSTNELGPGYLLMDKLPGKPLNWPKVTKEDPATRQRLLNQLADIFLELERHPLPSIGSLTSSSPVTVGRIGHPSAPSERRPLGPFETGAESYETRVRSVLDQIVTGELIQLEPVNAYLQFRWMLQQLHRGILLPKNDGPPFYLKHPDDKGDHILLDEQFNITGIIDWEWCFSTPRDYAFSSPCMLWPIDDWYASSNRLADGELELAAIYRERGRDDLAQFVLNGRLLQRFWFSLEDVLSDEPDTSLVFFKGLLSAAGVDVGPEEDWWKKWKEWALKEYHDDEPLQQLLRDEQQSKSSEPQPSQPHSQKDSDTATTLGEDQLKTSDPVISNGVHGPQIPSEALMNAPS
ncbi:MAG: hypothetical protein M1823_004713 [Watsoniomyces obsoletus]|nr:MAG: hypothetical protein M1823_004713 [Watsoniomyces obsoletus]